MGMRSAVAVFVLPIAVLNSIAQQPTDSGNRQNASPANQQLQEPIDAAPEPTNPVERELRLIRNRIHNNRNPMPAAAPVTDRVGRATAKRSAFDTRPSGPAGIIYVDRAPFPPNARPEDVAFPVTASDSIVLGSVTKVQPYLSEDETSLYSEFTVSVEEVFKDSPQLSLNPKSIIALFRMGGSLRLASGKIVRTDVHGLGDPPASGHRYVCFLHYDAR